jgi:hypothetical protein
MLPRTENLDSHSFTHHDIARMFDDRTVVTDISRTMFDSVPFDEPSTYSAGFTEPTFHSSFASIEANNLEDNSCLETFTSDALYTNNLSQKEADELSFAAIPSSEVLHYCLVLLPTLEFLKGSADLLCMLVAHERGYQNSPSLSPYLSLASGVLVSKYLSIDTLYHLLLWERSSLCCMPFNRVCMIICH